MSAAGKSPRCPRCGSQLDANAAGAWCTGYPCRWSVNRRRLVEAVKVARLIWGPIR